MNESATISRGFKDGPPPMPIRARAAAGLVVVLFLMGAGFFGLRLTGELLYWQAGRSLLNDRPDLAWSRLQAAADRAPGDSRIWARLGEAGYKMCIGSKADRDAHQWAGKAQQAYLAAQALNPIEPKIAYGLARVTRQLEWLHPRLFPRIKNPHNPVPYFERALALRPNGITYRYALVRYLFTKRKMDRLLGHVRILARCHPPVYYHLRKELFWLDPVREAVGAGLADAVARGIDPRDAHMALSHMLAEDGQWDEAIAAYERGLGYRSFENKPVHHIRRGALYLSAGRDADARHPFVMALDRSTDRSADLGRIFDLYRRLERADECLAFLDTLRSRYGPMDAIDILAVRCLYELKRYDAARQALARVLAASPSAEAWYWSARIAQQIGDWDTMELSAQKATVAEPEASRNHLLFSQALQKQKKFVGAEAAASKAIRFSPKPAAWIFSHRAWLRWSQKNWAGAVRDWQTAIRLQPEVAGFYAHAAEAYGKMGDAALYRKFYAEALARDPENARYRARLDQADNLKKD
ncbi:MAG: hypothetical protein JEZ11_17270 [Desulfobacterales bacterium]|nr:hypothetical protein [Desulfobacterales bacterium]